MFIDSLLNFIPPFSAFSLVGATGASFPSNVIDELGVGSGVAPPNIIGNVSLFGSDLGIGDNRPLVQINVGAALVTGNAGTLNVQFQGAPDTGSAGGYLPGTWQTYNETGQMTAAQLTAGAVARMDIPAAFPVGSRPRFYRLLFVTPSGASFTAGTIAAAFVTPDRDDQANKFAANNFTVA